MINKNDFLFQLRNHLTDWRQSG